MTVLKNKIQPGKFKDLIGFIKWLMNLAASHVSSRKAHWELYKMEGFYRQHEGD